MVPALFACTLTDDASTICTSDAASFDAIIAEPGATEDFRGDIKGGFLSRVIDVVGAGFRLVGGTRKSVDNAAALPLVFSFLIMPEESVMGT